MKVDPIIHSEMKDLWDLMAADDSLKAKKLILALVEELNKVYSEMEKLYHYINILQTRVETNERKPRD